MIITIKGRRGMYIKNTELAQNNKVEISLSALVIIVNESDLNF